jgi:glycosyltransferase involved in cell wall biosynthesis
MNSNSIESVTPLVLCYNEAPNIGRTLSQLTWAKRIVVIDSGSTDDTLKLIENFPQVEVIYRSFDSFAAQCNFGLQHIDTEWVLSLDADYVLDEKLKLFFQSFDQVSFKEEGFEVRFKYAIYGKPLRGALLPNRKVLYRRKNAKYVNDGHSHQVQIQGKIGVLPGFIHHDDRKSLSRWLWAQDRYAQQERDKFQSLAGKSLRLNDWIRNQIIIAPFVVFIYCLLFKGGILDGWRGWYYAFQRMLAELLLSVHLLDEKLNDGLNKES